MGHSCPYASEGSLGGKRTIIRYTNRGDPEFSRPNFHARMRKKHLSYPAIELGILD